MHTLIVDGNEPSCRLVEKIVQRAGFTADWTTSSRTGLAWAVERPYDIFLLDVCLPELQGTEFVAALKKHYPKAKIILISAFLDNAAQRVAHHLEAPLLPKPFSHSVLLAMMSHVVRRRR